MSTSLYLSLFRLVDHKVPLGTRLSLKGDLLTQGVKARQLKQKQRTKRALRAEETFLKHFTELGYQFRDERQRLQQRSG